MRRHLPNLASIFLGFTFWSAGMVKLFAGHQFIGWIGPPWLVERLAEFDLAVYASFIAICQISIGFMLLTARYKLLGGIMMIPMILNILMVTISQHWRGTPYVLTVLLVMNIYLLWSYRDFLGPLVDEGENGGRAKSRTPRSWQGHLAWLAGWSLQLISVTASYYYLPAAFAMAGVGLVISVLSFRVDRLYLRKSSQQSLT